MCWTWLSLNTSIVLLCTFMLAFSNRPPCCGTVQICFCPSSLQLLGPHFFFEVLFLPIGSISWHQILLLGEHKTKSLSKVGEPEWSPQLWAGAVSVGRSWVPSSDTRKRLLRKGTLIICSDPPWSPKKWTKGQLRRPRAAFLWKIHQLNPLVKVSTEFTPGRSLPVDFLSLVSRDSKVSEEKNPEITVSVILFLS